MSVNKPQDGSGAMMMIDSIKQYSTYTCTRNSNPTANNQRPRP